MAKQAMPVKETTPTRTSWELDREAVERAISKSGRRPPADLTELKPDGFGTDAQHFFAEFHQYYQADFSSYTPTASYKKKGEDTLRYAPNKQFAESFVWTTGAVVNGGELRLERGRFIYTEKYEGRYATLAAMFASPAKIVEEYTRIRALEARQQIEDLQ